ncbi:MAG: hypothetical protein RL223_4503, partial [Pseudomonadota bacterium]
MSHDALPPADAHATARRRLPGALAPLDGP